MLRITCSHWTSFYHFDDDDILYLLNDSEKQFLFYKNCYNDALLFQNYGTCMIESKDKCLKISKNLLKLVKIINDNDKDIITENNYSSKRQLHRPIFKMR